VKKPDWRKWMGNKEECKLWLDNYIKKGMLVRSKREEKLYFGKSEHNLNFANWLNGKQGELKRLFDETFYDWVISSYYYAIYHSALALVSRLNYKSNSHSATLCFIIHRYFHGNKLLEKEHMELVADSIGREDVEAVASSKSLRERASYAVSETFEKQLADDIKKEAVKFLAKSRVILGQ
jgi:uncharacterized protein (UPF0332 family)